MNPPDAGIRRNPRPDPLLFASETTLRFILLIVSIVGASLYFSYWVSVPWKSNLVDAIGPCREALAAAAPLSTDEEFLGQLQAQVQCFAPLARANTLWMVAGLALIVGLTLVMYLLHPRWIRWRRKLVALELDDAAEVMTYLRDLSREAGLRRPPAFLCDPLDSSISGYAFGRRGRYAIALSGGLVTRFHTDRPAFRTIVLHELAHLRNRDVDITFLAVSVWYAFVIGALLPYGAYIVRTMDSNTGSVWYSRVALSALILAALVYLTRNALLRVRELYADARAAEWEGSTGPLRRVLGALPPPKTGRWLDLVRVHPSPAARCRGLEDRSGLFRLSRWEAFGTGVIAMMALPSVQLFLTNLLHGTDIVSSQLGAALLLAALALGVVGLAVWRAPYACNTLEGAPEAAGRAGVYLGLGMILGELLSFEQVVYALSPEVWTYLVVERLPWGVLLLIGAVLTLKWIAVCASAWLDLPLSLSSRALRRACAVCLLFASIAFAVGVGFLATTRGIAFQLLDRAGPSQTAVLVGLYALAHLMKPVVTFSLIAAWALPFAAWMWRDEPTTRAAEGDSTGDTWQRYLHHRWRALTSSPLVRAGLAAGLLMCVLLLLARVGLRFALPEDLRGTYEFKFAVFYGSVLLAAAAQAVAGIRIMRRSGRLWALQGLAAACVAGCVMTAGILGSYLLLGSTVDFGFARFVATNVINVGGLLALVLAAGMAALGAWRSQRPRLGSALVAFRARWSRAVAGV